MKKNSVYALGVLAIAVSALVLLAGLQHGGNSPKKTVTEYGGKPNPAEDGSHNEHLTTDAKPLKFRVPRRLQKAFSEREGVYMTDYPFTAEVPTSGTYAVHLPNKVLTVWITIQPEHEYYHSGLKAAPEPVAAPPDIKKVFFVFPQGIDGEQVVAITAGKLEIYHNPKPPKTKVSRAAFTL